MAKYYFLLLIPVLSSFIASMNIDAMLPRDMLEAKKENMQNYEFVLSEQRKQHMALLNRMIEVGENILAYTLQQSEDMRLYTSRGMLLPWHEAAAADDCEKLRKLLANGGHEFRNEKGETPLHCAVAADKMNAVKCLLELGAYINALDIFGNTVFHEACAKAFSPTVRALLKHPALDYSVRNWSGQSAYLELTNHANSYVAKEMLPAIKVRIFLWLKKTDIRNSEGQKIQIPADVCRIIVRLYKLTA